MAKSRAKKGVNSKGKQHQNKGAITRRKASKATDIEYEDDLETERDNSSNLENEKQPSRDPTITDHIDKALKGLSSSTGFDIYEYPLNNGALTLETMKELDSLAGIIRGKVTSPKTTNPYGAIGEGRHVAKETIKPSHTSP